MADEEILYHYTDWHALFGIVEKGQLWASDWRMLNDSHEYKFSRDMLSDALETASASPRLDELREALDTIEAGSSNGTESIFVVSFSELRDDLPQWRSYADDGRGVAIGFRAADLRGLGLALKKVDYDELTQRAALAAKVQYLLSPQRRDKSMRWRAQELIRTCMGNKHPGFAAEREHRLVSAVTKHVAFRPTAHALVPTRLVQLKRADGFSGAPPAIAEIIIGPRSHAAAHETLRAYLHATYRRAAHPSVVRSAIPYVGPG